MAYPEALTTQQQAYVLALTDAMRAWLVLISQAVALGTAIQNDWAGGIATLVNTGLVAGDIVPNDTNLNGAQGLATADINNIQGWIALFIGTGQPATTGGYNLPLIASTAVKAVGINAMIAPPQIFTASGGLVNV